MKLYPYQEEGVRFLMERKRAYLADRMGLGKTVQAITAARRLGLRPVVIAPASAVPNWRREWEKWGGEGDIEAVSYSKLVRGADAEPAPLVVLDEAHYVKNPKAQRTKAALRLAMKSERAWLLSGTPMPNDPRELYTVFRYLWPERLPKDADGRTVNAFEWMNTFCHWRPTTYGPKVYGVKNAHRLTRMVNGIMLRRSLSSVGLDLPPLRITVHYLPHDPDFATRLEEIQQERGDLSTPEARRILGLHKVGAVGRQLQDELDAGEYRKIVVMYHHRDVGAALRDGFSAAGHMVTGFDGSTPQDKRQEAIDLFQHDPRCRAFVVQQQAGGVAINLTAASEIALVEPDWSPEVNAQAIKRVHRIGQGRPVRARLWAVEGTLDVSVMEAIAMKVEMRKEVVG